MHRLRNLATFAIALGWLVLTPLSALAETMIKSAPEIQAALRSGETILLDIRSESEWRETGLAQGAWPVSMHTAEFGNTLQKLLAVYKPENIAIMCAVGGRSAHVANILKQNGINGITDLSEGMMGNKRGPGWIARGLPVISLEEAQADFKAHAKIP